MTINNILNSKTLQELLNATEDFCKTAIIAETDESCMELKEKLHNINDNDYLMILSSYLSVAEDGDDVIEALYEFVANCKGFAETEDDMMHQVTKEEFEAVLEECEDKCGAITCIEENHILNVAEVPLYNKYREFNLKVKDYSINLFLPKIDINKNVREYISEDIGAMLYEVIVKRLGKDFVCKEMNRYIPETRNRHEESVKQLFKKYFYQVVLYKERKPGIYTEFDDHMKRVIVLEFFKRIISAYLEHPTAGKHS